MNLFNVGAMLAMGQTQTPSGTQQDPRAAILSQVGFLVIIVVMFYFLLIRPQQKKQKEHAAMLQGVRAGDKIVTSGGVIGVVVTVKDKSLTIRSADAKFEITKSAIAEILERGSEASAS